MNTLTLNKKAILTKAIIAVIAVASAVALPQIFHLIGKISGLGAALGETFLPMHLPVLFAALLGGPIVGIVVGALSPLLSYAISGMPGAIMLPFMVIELAVYGLSLGLLAQTKMPVVAKVFISQIAGRAIRAIALVIAFYAFNYTVLNIATIWMSILVGLPGIILQLTIVPLAMFYINNRKNNERT